MNEQSVDFELSVFNESGRLRLSWNTLDVSRVSVTDLTGKQLFDSGDLVNVSEIGFQTSSWASGPYQVILYSADKDPVSRRIFVQGR